MKSVDIMESSDKSKKQTGKKKVMIFANNDIWLFKLRKEIIVSFLDNGYEVIISSPKGDFVQKMVDWGCTFYETQVDRRGTNPKQDFKLLVSYIKLINKVKPDVVLTYTIKPNLYGGLACRLTNTPCINNITGLGSGFSKSPMLKLFLTTLYKVSLKKSACVFFQNTQDMEDLTKRKIVQGPTKLIPGSGVNLEEYGMKDFPKEEDASFIFIGRIMKDKGIDQYLEAAKIIKQMHPNTMFRIVGFVEETQSHYNDLIKNYEDEGIISFLGYQANVKPFIENAHCIIQASHGGEGLSNVLLETAATGRVLIASNIPGCKETIDEGRNGFIFEKKNTNDLVDKIEKFISLPYIEKQMYGMYSRKKIENEFNREIVVSAYLKAVKTIVRG